MEGVSSKLAIIKIAREHEQELCEYLRQNFIKYYLGYLGGETAIITKVGEYVEFYIGFYGNCSGSKGFVIPVATMIDRELLINYAKKLREERESQSSWIDKELKELRERANKIGYTIVERYSDE